MDTHHRRVGVLKAMRLLKLHRATQHLKVHKVMLRHKVNMDFHPNNHRSMALLPLFLLHLNNNNNSNNMEYHLHYNRNQDKWGIEVLPLHRRHHHQDRDRDKEDIIIDHRIKFVFRDILRILLYIHYDMFT